MAAAAAAPAAFTYTDLLSSVNEASFDQLSPAKPVEASLDEVNKISENIKVPRGKKTSARRLQVFADIPESLGDSQLSIEQ